MTGIGVLCGNVAAFLVRVLVVVAVFGLGFFAGAAWTVRP